MISSRTLSLDTVSLMHASHMSLCCRIKEIEDEMARTQKNKVQALKIRCCSIFACRNDIESSDHRTNISMGTVGH